MNEMLIKSIKGYELLDSRGNPTVAAKVTLSGGETGFAVVPSGASTGMFEAHEKRDGGERFGGKGVKSCVDSINGEIAAGVISLNTLDQRKIDNYLIELDGTENKSRLGANSLLAVSLAVAKAAAKYYKMPLYRYLGGINAKIMPRPMLNILNGGAHSQNNIDIQEFMIVPTKAESFCDGLRQCTEIYHELGKILKEKGLHSGVGDEGGFAPNLKSDSEALEIIVNAIEKAGYSTEQIKLALDIASSEWYKDGQYFLPKRNIKMSGDDLINYYKELIKNYPVISIEDGAAEQDFEGWKKLTSELGDKIQLVGDDLFVTNKKRLKKGIDEKCGNSILIKLNQIGTLTETMDVISMAQKHGYSAVISHRSGESEDSTIADLAVAVNAGQIKTGAPCRSERTAKYNRLLLIEEEINR